MKEIEQLFKELYVEIFKISFLHAFTDAIIFFFVSLNLTTLLDVKYHFALIASLIFLVADIAYRMKHTTLKKIEKNNPDIQDILRTAKDNFNNTNFMVLAMFEDLIKRMRKVSAGSMINSKHLFLKVFVMCLLSFSVLTISANNIHIPKTVFDPDTYYQWFSKPDKDSLRFYTTEFNESEDIYGNPELAGLGDKELEIKMSPSVNEMGFETVQAPEEKSFEKGTFPDEVYAQSDAASEEKLPKESKIAIEYNLRLKEE